MLDCSPTCVSPITRAVSAMNTPGPICGRRPRYSRTLPTMRILAMYVAKCKADLARFGEPHGTRKANAAYLAETLDENELYGFDRRLLDSAFQLFQLESELDDDRLRLAPIEGDVFDAGEGVFALPLIDDEEMGAHYDFLDAITGARIRKLNATHKYAQPCSELEMREELDELDRDRYIAAENIHCFDEINEILQWSPAEWDEP